MTKTKTIAPIANIAHLGDVHGFLKQTRQEKLLCLFGRPGLGKTEACRYLAAHARAIYFQIPPNPTPFAFASSLSLVLGIGKGRGFTDTLAGIADELAARKQTLLLDEAGRLFHRHRDQLAEVARYLHDTAGIPVVLAGMPDLRQALGRYPQLSDRTYFIEFRPWSISDCGLVAKLCYGLRVREDLIRQIHATTQGNGRLVARSLEVIEHRLLQTTKEGDPLPEIGLTEWGSLPLLPEVA